MKHKYCSVNLQNQLYKTFTCPPTAVCPDKAPAIHMHQDFESDHVVQKSWGWFNGAFNCRISI